MDAARGPRKSLAVHPPPLHTARPNAADVPAVSPSNPARTPTGQISGPLAGPAPRRITGPRESQLAEARFATTKAGWVMCSAEDSPSGLWRSPGTRVGVYSPSGVQIPYPPL